MRPRYTAPRALALDAPPAGPDFGRAPDPSFPAPFPTATQHLLAPPSPVEEVVLELGVPLLVVLAVQVPRSDGVVQVVQVKVDRLVTVLGGALNRAMIRGGVFGMGW